MLGRRSLPSDDGAAALEFAIVAALALLPLLFGMIEFGFMFQDQLALTNAAREGARIAAVGEYNAATVIARAAPVVPTIETDPIDVSKATSGQAITVKLTYDYHWQILPFPGTIPLRSQATMRRE